MAKSLRERIREKAKQLTEEASQSNKYTYSSGESYYSLPEGVSQFIPTTGKDGKGELHRLDLIMFARGEVFPDQTFGSATVPEVGDPVFRLDLNVHFGVGPDNLSVVCPKHSFRSKIAKGEKKGCPICEMMEQKQSEVSDKEKRTEIYKAFRPKRRCMYNVIIRDGDEEEAKGVQVYEASHFVFQEKLNDAQDMLRKEGEGEVNYADCDDGRLILFNAFKDKFGDNEYTNISGVKFKERVRNKKEYLITDDELEQAHDLGQFLKLYSYDEIAAMISEDAKPSKPKVDDEEDEDETPPFESRKKKTEKKVEEKVEEEDEEVCPHGYELGISYLEQPECEDCENLPYRLCMQAHKALRKSKKK